MKFSYKGYSPKVADDVYIAPGAQVIGDVEIGAGSSIWPNAVVRGDMAKITIGQRTNIQDNCTLHVDDEHPLIIGDDVTVGHNAVLHGCTIGNNALIGMGAIILDGAKIGDQALIGAGTLIPPGKEIPPRSLVVGSPGKVVRELKDEELAALKRSAEVYAKKAQTYRKQVQPYEDE
ncbi:gamma carbonic anhydrase family protein [Anoxybacter fermentans]|uniref:Gamma carbonic anhydrase family protein n=1 Tax=Anoxybacter fermentans TaxID=1323375 RepID=A0A3Q9HND4_9FIRM|nr:gamma carbonic anhydrase family protein [Anoxybacter fermentans]AZR71974.1 gamma carbonic anhydrase family protein [Anoxybacter fermentans]